MRADGIPLGYRAWRTYGPQPSSPAPLKLWHLSLHRWERSTVSRAASIARSNLAVLLVRWDNKDSIQERSLRTSARSPTSSLAFTEATARPKGFSLSRCNWCNSFERWSGRGSEVSYSALSWRPIVSRNARLQADLSARSTGDRDTRSLPGARPFPRYQPRHGVLVPNVAQAVDRVPFRYYCRGRCS